MTKQELNQWYTLRKQVVNGWHMSDQDMQELLMLNHEVLLAASKIHNDNLLDIKPLQSDTSYSYMAERPEITNTLN